MRYGYPVEAQRRATRLGRWRLLVLAYFAFIVTVGIAADRQQLHVPVRPPWDKLVHFVLIGLAAPLLDRALGSRNLGRVPLGPAIVMVAACADEFRQLGVPTRSFTYGDLAANIAGVVAFTFVGRRHLAVNPGS